jgi:hypothetical protein
VLRPLARLAAGQRAVPVTGRTFAGYTTVSACRQRRSAEVDELARGDPGCVGDRRRVVRRRSGHREDGLFAGDPWVVVRQALQVHTGGPWASVARAAYLKWRKAGSPTALRLEQQAAFLGAPLWQADQTACRYSVTLCGVAEGRFAEAHAGCTEAAETWAVR